MGLKIARDIQYKKWAMRLIYLNWWFVLLICVIEVAIFAVWCADNSQGGHLAYLLSYAVYPTLFNVAVLGAIHIASIRLLRVQKYLVQAMVYTIGATVLVFSVVWTHRLIVVIHPLFVIPILLSQIFVSRKVRLFTFWLNFAAYLLFILMVFLFVPADMPGFMNVFTTIALIIGCFAITRLLQAREQEFVDDAAQANQRSMQDSLTKLYNHAAFYEQLDEHIMRYTKEKREFGLLIFDIDDFKKINDQYGHDMGDQVILELVATIRDHIDGEDLAFRYGGEEFTVLSTRAPEACMAFAQSVRGDFATRAKALHPLASTVSVGICAFDGARYNGRREFFASADEALYEAKRTGKDKAILWTPKLLERP